MKNMRKRQRRIVAAALVLGLGTGAAILPVLSASAQTCNATPADASRTDYVKPFVGDTKWKSFGFTTGSDCAHTGTDWNLHDDSIVNWRVDAVNAGEVIAYSDDPCFGNYIVIRHADGNKSIYAHLRDTDAQNTRVDLTGAKKDVTAGQQIAVTGGTGSCPDPAHNDHLHFSFVHFWDGWNASAFMNGRSFLDDHGVNWQGEE